MKVPEEITDVFLEDKLEEEIIKLSGLTKDRALHVLTELDSPEYENRLSYILAAINIGIIR